MCNLHCVFCQNYDISHAAAGAETLPKELAGMMLALQSAGCHNINFVTPDHFVPQILEALVIAVEKGLTLPLVYNTSGYTSAQALAWLDGVVDIYMPDFKTADPGYAKTFLQAKDYPEVAEAAIWEMHRQTGDLHMDENGIALRGVLVRHLVMPGWTEDSRQIMKILADISPDTFINIMAQYRPAGKVHGKAYPEINRRPTWQEAETVVHAARQAGLWRLDKH
jgi:putative pyruvate formate lyase activating enzyme